VGKDKRGIEDFLQIRSANSPVYSPCGGKVRFISNLSGQPQLWEIQRGDGQPTRVVSISDRIMTATFFPSDERMVIGTDVGGNERQSVSLLHPNGEITALTHRPDLIYHFGGISADGQYAAWSSNERHSAFFDVYVYHLETGESTCLFQSDGTNHPVRFSPDGGQLLISQLTSNMDNRLLLVDVHNKASKLLTSSDGEALYQQAQFSKDGKYLYLLSNTDREFMGIAQLECGTGKLEFLVEKPWDIETLALNPSSERLAFTINEGGYSTLCLFDLKQGEILKPVNLPKGVIDDLTWSPDGQHLCFTLDGSVHPKDLWELEMESGKVERLTFVSESSVLDQLVEPELVEFTSFDGLKVPAFYYKPKQTEGLLPVIVYVHGGPESQTRASFHPALQYFVNHGFAVLAPNVRGSTGYGRTYTHLDDIRKRMDSVADLAAAVDWLKLEGQANPNAIAVMGRSYGGFMVLAAITAYPHLWACAIDQVGIANFRTFLENTGPWRRKLREPEYGSLENDADFLDQISPIHHVDRITAPLLVQHGRNDPRVPVGEAEQIVDQLERLGREVEYICFEDEGHQIIKLPNVVHAFTAFAEFLEKWLGPHREGIKKQ
jgi:dipeptidyl aminopeptidase/acylaminoacyl peptidase